MGRAEDSRSRSAAIQIKLAAAALIAFVLAAVAWRQVALRDSEIDEWRATAGNLALTVAEHADATLEPASLVLARVVANVRMHNVQDAATLLAHAGDPTLQQMLDDTVTGIPQLVGAAITDADGALIARSRTEPPIARIADWERLRQLATDRPAESALLAPVRLADGWVIVLFRPLTDARGGLIGMALVGVSSSFFARYYQRIVPGPGTSIALFDRDYTLLARVPAVDGALGRTYPSGAAHYVVTELGKASDVVLLDRARAAAPGENPRRLAAVRALERFPVIVAVQVDENVFLGRFRRNLAGVGIAVSAAIALIIALAWLFLRLLRRRERELAANVVLKQRAEGANRAKSEFLASMSHELRTPLAAILGHAELLARRAGDDLTRESAGHIETSGRHLMGLLNEILDLAKVEAGRVRVDVQDVPVADLVAEVVELHRPNAGVKGLSLSCTVASDVPATIRTDGALLRQVLINLLSNAIKFTDAGSVRVAVNVALNRARFSVADTGPGVPLELQDVIFEPFRQGEAFVTRRHGGTGLGLALARDLVRLLGGAIWLESRPGEGATFHFDVPLARDAR